MEPSAPPLEKDGVSTPLGSTERERRLARLRLEKQRQRELERMRRRAAQRRAAGIVLGIVVVAALGYAISQRQGGGSTSAAGPTPSASPLACSYIPDATTNPVVTTLPTPPGFGTRRNGSATMVTNRGTVVFDLLVSDAPCATTSFAFLADKQYFDGGSCPRLTSGDLKFLQCGDPKTGTGPGYTFPDESLTKTTSYPAGTVAMANHGPNSNGSEFFLTYGDTALPPDYVPFGRITSGLDVLQQIARDGETPVGDGAPDSPVTVTSIRTSGT